VFFVVEQAVVRKATTNKYLYLRIFLKNLMILGVKVITDKFSLYFIRTEII